MNRSILNKKKDRKGLYVVAGFVVAVCASLYPIVVYPYLNIGKYRSFFVFSFFILFSYINLAF